MDFILYILLPHWNTEVIACESSFNHILIILIIITTNLTYIDLNVKFTTQYLRFPNVRNTLYEFYITSLQMTILVEKNVATIK